MCLVPSADSRAGPCIVILLIENVFVTCHMRRAPRASIKNTYIIQQRVHKYSVFRSLKRQTPCEKIGPEKPVLSALDFFAKSRLSASLPGSLAASDALGLARSGFEATPVIDADHGVSES